LAGDITKELLDVFEQDALPAIVRTDKDGHWAGREGDGRLVRAGPELEVETFDHFKIQVNRPWAT
jgi:hypothetical protein